MVAEVRPIKTADGSLTLFHEQLGAHYHSVHGAVQESMHIFIRNGLEQLSHLPEINLLEMGFGTGLNVWLTGKNKPTSQIIKYTSLDTYVLDTKVVHELKKSYSDDSTFEQIHSAKWDKQTPIAPDFILTKKHISLTEYIPDSNFHLCYFDAFAPEVQPELWTPAIFEKLYQCLYPGGLLLTYCAKGEVKRALRSCGFTVQRLAGPPGKRHIIRAVK